MFDAFVRRSPQLMELSRSSLVWLFTVRRPDVKSSTKGKNVASHGIVSPCLHWKLKSQLYRVSCYNQLLVSFILTNLKYFRKQIVPWCCIANKYPKKVHSFAIHPVSSSFLAIANMLRKYFLRLWLVCLRTYATYVRDRAVHQPAIIGTVES